jgi:phosphoenolpyruvate carboxykinase (GTP)
MRPFMGYNFGQYLQHWLSLHKPNRKMPKIFHVNWFRKSPEGKFLWPGFGDNIRVIDWIIQRLDGVEEIGEKSPIGILPKKGSINMDGVDHPVPWEELMSVPKDYWHEDAKEVRKFIEAQIGPDLPEPIRKEMDAQEERIAAL